MERVKIKQLARHKGDFDQIIELSQADKRDLPWWMANTASLNKNIVISDPDIIIYTDASREGWGCHVPKTDQYASGRWSLEEQGLHINALELLAVYLSLQAIFSNESAKHIKVMTYNTVTMLCIRNQGSTASKHCNRVARNIWLWAIERNIWLSAYHCPGVLASLTWNGS